MPHNFRILPAGAFYVSKVGNDANAGTDPNLPKATISAYGANTVIGTGVYKGAFTTAINNMNLECDREVVINATGNFVFGAGSGSQNINANPNSGTFTVLLNNFTFFFNSVNSAASFRNCIWINGLLESTTTGGTNTSYTRCIFANVTFNRNQPITLNYCSIYNSNFPLFLSANNIVLTNTYIDASSVINVSTYYTSPTTQFRNNNFRGILNVNGVLYELKRDRAGNTINPNPAVNDLIAIDATVYTRGNFSEDMDYVNIDKRGYQGVANSSPALFGDSTGFGGIANTFFAHNYNTSEDTGVTDTNITVSANDLIVTSPAALGTRITSPIQIAPIAQAIGRLNLRIALNFNSSQLPLGNAENNNVTIVDNYPVGHSEGGDNPRRLTYEMRWSNKTTIPLVDADWDNQGYISAGSYAKFEHNTMPLIDPAGRGNGEPLYTSTGAAGLKAKWIQFRITVRNGIG